MTVGDEDPDFAGGSYVIVQKYLHDLTAWNAISVEEQERVIGRTKLADIELPDDVKPANSHVALNTIVDADGDRATDRAGQHAVRRASATRRVRHVLHRLRRRPRGDRADAAATCSSADPPGNHDRILDFSTAVTGTPVLRADRGLPRRPAPRPGPAAASDRARQRTRPRRRPVGTRPDDSLGIGSLKKERHVMNNLHRELAPISDAAWADIEDEARRTFTRHVAGRRVVDVIGPAGEPLSAVGTGHLPAVEPPRRRCARARAPGAAARRVAGRRSPSPGRPWTTSSAAPRTRTGSRSRTPPSRSRSPRTAPSSTASPRPASPGIAPAASNPPLAAARRRRATYPDAVAQALSALRLAGVDGPYSLLLSRRRVHRGRRDHRPRLPDPRAPRPGARRRRRDRLGARASTARCCCPPAAATTSCTWARTCRSATSSHDADPIELYFQESLTFLVQHHRGCRQPGLTTATGGCAPWRRQAAEDAQFLAGCTPADLRPFTVPGPKSATPPGSRSPRRWAAGCQPKLVVSVADDGIGRGEGP